MSALIPQEFIDQLLARVDIVDVIDSRVPLTKKGANHSACCPFHQEKTPSFTVSQSKQFYYCFGCGASGSAIKFLMEYEHCSFVEAIEKLAHSVGMNVPRDNSPRARQKRAQQQSLHSVLEAAYKHYQLELARTASAQQYLQQRGVPASAIAHFGLGYAPAGWDFLIKHIGKDQASVALLNQAGMLSEKDGRHYDRFRERIMFPIHDSRGRIIGFGGRVMGSGEPKYLNSPETPLFAKGRELYGWYQAKQAGNSECILVVEGYMDVVMLAAANITNVVATLGTACTSEHLKRLMKSHAQIIFCFDGDKAGRGAAWRALENALPELNDQSQLSFLFLPEGEDPDSIVKTHGRAHFLALCEQAQPLSAYMLDKLKQQFDINHIDGINRMAAAAKALINQINAPIYANLLRESVAKLARTSVSTLFGDNPGARANLPAPKPARAVAKNRVVLNLKRKIISALIWQPSLANTISEDDLDLIDSLEDKGTTFIVDLFDLLRDQPELTSAAILSRYADSPYAQSLQDLIHSHAAYAEQDAHTLALEFQDAIAKLCQRAKSQKFIALSARPEQTLSASEVAFIKNYRRHSQT